MSSATNDRQWQRLAAARVTGKDPQRPVGIRRFWTSVCLGAPLELGAVERRDPARRPGKLAVLGESEGREHEQ